MERSLSDDLAFQEWQASRATVGAFDKIQLDLRKYGFSLITILLGVNGIVSGEAQLNTLSIFGIYLTILVLIVGLFRLDRVYHVFIRAAVMRAMRLEANMQMRLTIEISKWSESARTDTWGNFLYICLTIAAAVIALAGVVDTTIKEPMVAYGLIVAIWLGALFSIFLLHYRTAALRKEFDDMINELQGTAEDRGALHDHA